MHRSRARRLQGPRRGLTIRRGTSRLVGLAALAAALLPGTALGSPSEPQRPEPQARSYILVDAEDGDVLAARGADRESSIASATKLMTAYVASRSLRLDEIVAAPAYEALSAESLLGLEPGERIRVRDLLYGLLLVSGNDAAIALAEASAGSVDAFVEEMNRAADELGLEDTSYANPIGLDEAGNHSTARDLADLAVELRADPFLRRVFDTAAYDTRSGIRSRHLVNRNTLVHSVPFVSGVKTGYTLSAGYVLVASGERRGVKLVSVVLGAPSESARDQASLDLLRWGHSLYRSRRVLVEGERLAAVAIRDQGVELPLLAAADVRVVGRADERVSTEVDAPAELDGPIERGERLGRAVISVDGDRIRRVALLAARPVPAASVLERLDGALPGSRFVVWALAVALLGAAFAALGWVGRRRSERPSLTRLSDRERA